MAPIFDRLRRRRADMPFCTAVVPAAGSSTRMEGQDKILLTLGDYPVLVRTLQALEACTRIQEIVVVTREDIIVPVSQLCRDFALEKVTHIVTGGATRTQSVLNGIREASPQAGLEEVIDRAVQCGAAAPAVPVTDTVKRAMNGIVEETVDRDTLFAVQTPQVFEASLIKAALQRAVEEGVTLTDDCAAVERLGMKVALTRGDRANIKLTTPTDLDLGLGILNGRGEFV